MLVDLLQIMAGGKGRAIGGDYDDTHRAVGGNRRKLRSTGR